MILSKSKSILTKTLALNSVKSLARCNRHLSAAVESSVLSSSDPLPDAGYNISENFRTGRAAYLDMSVTTPPPRPRVFDKMTPYIVGSYGNPRSRTHSYGWETEAAVEQAREQIL